MGFHTATHGAGLGRAARADKTIMRSFILSLALTATAAFNAPVSRIAPSRAAAPTMGLSVKAPQLPAAAMAAMIMLHAEAAHAKGVIGVSGGLDFGPLAGNQPGGEGTGKALGVNDTSLFGVLLAIPVIIGVLFSQWQDYQDDDDDFFDSYDSRRDDRELTNRNRV